ncbi:MAG: hypothetical protein LBE53_17000 [Paucimonas sp.]|nr:hypothetical protein [Paucimonas sp.]
MMLIDGNQVLVTEIEIDEARRQLALPDDFFLMQATQRLYHDPGDGTVMIPLPADMLVVNFEDSAGNRKFGVVRINSLKQKLPGY